LPALLSICHVLGCTADRLLYDNLSVPNKSYLRNDIANCFEDVTMKETAVMLAVASAAKESMRNHT
jgi:hypothetical protein